MSAVTFGIRVLTRTLKPKLITLHLRRDRIPAYAKTEFFRSLFSRAVNGGVDEGFRVHVRTEIYRIRPEGTAEPSPGRQSWVGFERATQSRRDR